MNSGELDQCGLVQYRCCSSIEKINLNESCLCHHGRLMMRLFSDTEQDVDNGHSGIHGKTLALLYALYWTYFYVMVIILSMTRKKIAKLISAC